MRRPLCLLALVVAAAWWILLSLVGLPEDPYAAWDNEPAVCTARVVSKEYKRSVRAWSGEETLTLLVTVDEVQGLSAPLPATDRVLVRVPASERGQSPRIGSTVRIRGTLAALQPATNHGGFDGYLYYRTLGYVLQIRKAGIQEMASPGPVYWLDNALAALRDRLHDVLYACCRTGEDADILAAMLLGEKGWLSQEIKDLYQSAGIIHILAISGLHIAILGMGCYRGLLRCRAPRPVCHIVPVILMLLYGRMTGMSASSLRAIIMFLLHMLARSVHRTYDLLSALSVAGILLIVQEPLYLYNAAFQFSYGAVLSVGLLTDILPADILTTRARQILWQCRRRMAAWCGRPAPTALPSLSLQGLAVTIGTFPVNLVVYGTFPLYSVLLNALVLPLMSLLLPAGLLLLAGGLLLLPLGRLLGLPVHYFLHFYLVLCALAQGLPGHTQIPGHPAEGMILIYLLLMGLLVLARRRGRLPGVLVLVYIVGAMELLTWHVAGGLRLHVVDVGQGDGLYIECDGSRILVDGGSSDRTEVARYDLQPLLTWYGAGEIDLAIMTHADTDHMNGLLALLTEQEEHGIRIRQLAVPDVAPAMQGENYKAVVAAAQAAGTEVLYLQRGMVLRAGGLAMTCLHPMAEADYTEANETSVTLYLTYGSFSALLTGDLEGAGEEELLAYMALRPDLFPLTADGDPETADAITFLKVAHHGSRGATSAAFLTAITPRYAAISCGENNRYGHPHAETLERLTAAGAELLDTRITGEITLTTDGRTLQIDTYTGRR